jgi:poly(A) polymerase
LAKAGLYALGESAYRNRILIAWIRSGATPADAAWCERVDLPKRWQPPRFPVGGADVLALGVPAGPRVGDLLSKLESWWIDGDFSADTPALQQKLRELAGAS